jgi:hypothetical protein
MGNGAGNTPRELYLAPLFYVGTGLRIVCQAKCTTDSLIRVSNNISPCTIDHIIDVELCSAYIFSETHDKAHTLQ